MNSWYLCSFNDHILGVYYVTPNTGSTEGGTRIRIVGTGMYLSYMCTCVCMCIIAHT